MGTPKRFSSARQIVSGVSFKLNPGTSRRSMMPLNKTSRFSLETAPPFFFNSFIPKRFCFRDNPGSWVSVSFSSSLAVSSLMHEYSCSISVLLFLYLENIPTEIKLLTDRLFTFDKTRIKSKIQFFFTSRPCSFISLSIFLNSFAPTFFTLVTPK